MWTFLATFLSSLLQGLFKKDPQRELGQNDVNKAQLESSNQSLKNEIAIKSRPAGSDDDLVSRL